MKPLLKGISQRIDQLNSLVGRTIAWLTLAMVVATCTVVLARYAFNVGSNALQESVTFMHGIVFMLAIAYTLKEQGHVRVDVLYERLPARTRIWIDLAGHCLLLLPVGVFLLWTSIDYVSFSWSVREASGQPGGLPGVYLLKSLIPLMASLLILQGISEILRGILALLDNSPEPGTGNSPEPGTMNSPEPGTMNSPEPGTGNSPEPDNTHERDKL